MFGYCFVYRIYLLLLATGIGLISSGLLSFAVTFPLEWIMMLRVYFPRIYVYGVKQQENDGYIPSAPSGSERYYIGIDAFSPWNFELVRVERRDRIY